MKFGLTAGLEVPHRGWNESCSSLFMSRRAVVLGDIPQVTGRARRSHRLFPLVEAGSGMP